MTKKDNGNEEQELIVEFLEILYSKALPDFLSFVTSGGAVEILQTISDVHIEAAIDRLNRIENSKDPLKDLYSVRDHIHTAHIAAKRSLEGWRAFLGVIFIVGILKSVSAIHKVYETAAMLAVIHAYFGEQKNVTSYVDTMIEYYNQIKDTSWALYRGVIQNGGYARMPEFEESDKALKQLSEELAPGRLEAYRVKKEEEERKEKKGFFGLW